MPFLTPPPEQDPPAPGTGTVWVVQDRFGQWRAVWHDDENHTAWCEGTEEEEVTAWALAQPAERRLILRDGMEDYVELRAPE